MGISYQVGGSAFCFAHPMTFGVSVHIHITASTVSGVDPVSPTQAGVSHLPVSLTLGGSLALLLIWEM